MQKLGLAAMFAASVCLLPGAAVRAQAPATVLVVAPFNVHEARRDTRDFDGAGTAIADLLAADLHAITGSSVAERGPVRRTVALQPHSSEGMLGRQGAVDAARLLNAQHVVMGGFAADASGNVRVDARAVNVGTGTVEATERLQGRGDDILALIQQLAMRLAAGMSLQTSGTPAGGSALPLRALVDYGRALDAGDRGDTARARQLLEGLVRDHPDFAPAKVALSALAAR